jgi:hypothetical protein
MGRVSWVLGTIVFLLVTPPAWSQERELSLGHPVQLEDAFFVPTGEGVLLATVGGVVPRRGSTFGDLRADLQYGLFPRTQVTLGTLASSDPDQQSSGNLNFSARVSLCEESTYLPFLAAQVGAEFPTGSRSHGTDVELKGFATRSLTLGLLPVFLHLNAAVDGLASGRRSDDRPIRYHLAFGPSFTIPWHAPATLVADVAVDQSDRRHVAETIRLELGVRYRISATAALHASVGTDIAGPADRSQFIVRLGLGIGFSGPALGP